MGTSETHLERQGYEPRACDTCGTPYTSGRSWARFCSTRCRNAFHGAEARVDKIKERAVDLYRALDELGKVEGPVGTTARAAIEGLKPPVEPKALLEKAKA